MRLVCLALLCACVAAGPSGIAVGKVCTGDGDCNDQNLYGLRKNMRWATNPNRIEYDADLADSNGICCGMGDEKRCLDGRFDECTTETYNQLDVNRPASGYIKPCGYPGYCNTYNTGCVTSEDVNGYERRGCYAQGKMTPKEGMNIVAIPLFFGLATLIALALVGMQVKDAMGSMEMPQKICALMCFLLVLWGFFLFFSVGWKYGVVMVTASCMTLISFSGGSKTVSWIVFFVQLSLMLYLIGVLPNIFLDYGGGILAKLDDSCAGTGAFYEDHFVYTDQRTGTGPDMQPNSHNPSISRWGYCGDGWLTWERIVSAFGIICSCFLWVLYTTKSLQD